MAAFVIGLIVLAIYVGGNPFVWLMTADRFGQVCYLFGCLVLGVALKETIKHR